MSDDSAGNIVSHDTATIYRTIGEFVVTYQWIESRMREIGWLILDPHRHVWPPLGLRKESNEELVSRVQQLYSGLLDSIEIEDKDERRCNFAEIAAACHRVRRRRHSLLHSAYVELNAGGEVRGLLRADPMLGVDPETGETTFDQELLSQQGMEDLMGELAKIAFQLNMHYIQLIHWAPFEHLRSNGT